MNSEQSTKPLNKFRRKECWIARDNLFNCLENYPLAKEKDRNICAEFRNALDESCPLSWSIHFTEKHFNERSIHERMSKLGATDIKKGIENGDVIVKSE